MMRCGVVADSVVCRTMDESSGLRFFPGELVEVLCGRTKPVMPDYLGDVP
jgi:hypothetical protein